MALFKLGRDKEVCLYLKCKGEISNTILTTIENENKNKIENEKIE